MEIRLYDRTIDLGPAPSKLAVKRWTGVMSPEPETVAWIESLPQKKMFFDIGASVGTHAIRASLCGLFVRAFEPLELVYDELFGTVSRNDLPILCSKLAFHSTYTHGCMTRGRSTATFEPKGFVGQPSFSTTLDRYCSEHFYDPDYIKLDVDGNEEAIIRGGEEVLRRGNVKSMLIEVDPVVSPNLVGMMKELGYRYDQAQVDACMITVGKYAGTANYIFYK